LTHSNREVPNWLVESSINKTAKLETDEVLRVKFQSLPTLESWLAYPTTSVMETRIASRGIESMR
jgi:hypothetical protein